MTTAAAGTGAPDAGTTTKTPEQLATEKATADAAAAAAAASAGTKTPEQIATEKATADTAAADAKRKEDEAIAASKAPTTYALTLPTTDRLDASDLPAFAALAKTRNWTNDEAQAALEAHVAEREALAIQFLAETTADPVYGGAHLAETQRLANLALDRIQPKGTPAGDRTRAMLQKTGYGNHLVYVSLMADAGKLMAEDNPATGRAHGSGTTKDPAAVLYDHAASAAG